MADKCQGVDFKCYSLKFENLYPSVLENHFINTALSMADDFVCNMIEEIKNKRRLKYFRIHADGDFYSIGYIKKWLAIMKACPDSQFYAYTKSHKLVKRLTLPKNFYLIQSYGGKHDQLIDKSKPDAYVFNDLGTLNRQGFINCSDNDMNVFKGIKIGLIKR